ncbi:hypothetical protein [Xanthomonas dyei]|uniref:hypothetical protein n=1 Tax=Xanthomonas dyei TaxID=743699 RepID=UPI001E6478E1|nr:hypothetical protein [Xanthomonas dyei]MCC4633036.1 hypothetical protein [Xanthomonas dyei pv. eucalypti]
MTILLLWLIGRLYDLAQQWLRLKQLTRSTMQCRNFVQRAKRAYTCAVCMRPSVSLWDRRRGQDRSIRSPAPPDAFRGADKPIAS